MATVEERVREGDIILRAEGWPLVVVSVPRPARADEWGRARACARYLLEALGAWGRETPVLPPVEEEPDDIALCPGGCGRPTPDGDPCRPCLLEAIVESERERQKLQAAFRELEDAYKAALVSTRSWTQRAQAAMRVVAAAKAYVRTERAAFSSATIKDPTEATIVPRALEREAWKGLVAAVAEALEEG